MQRTKVCRVRSSGELIRALRQLRIACKDEESSREKKLLVIIDSLPTVIFKVPNLYGFLHCRFYFIQHIHNV